MAIEPQTPSEPAITYDQPTGEVFRNIGMSEKSPSTSTEPENNSVDPVKEIKNTILPNKKSPAVEPVKAVDENKKVSPDNGENLGNDLRDESAGGESRVEKYEANLLPSSLIQASSDGDSAIVVEKKSQTFRLYRSRHGEFVKIMEVPCSTGEVDGSKRVEGDKKTPEGIYFLKKIHEERFLAPIYGKRAFTTDYPNIFDRLMGKTGSSIWIHGTNKRLKPMDSNGCVALNNDDVVKIGSYISLDQTPVIIMDRVSYANPEALNALRVEIMNFLSGWISSLNSGSYLEYLYYYSSDHIPDVRWWSEWVEARKKAAGSSDPITASFDNVGIYGHKDHIVVLFDFELTTKYKKIPVGRRKLFIRPGLNIQASSAEMKNGSVEPGSVKKIESDSAAQFSRVPDKNRRGLNTPSYMGTYKIAADTFQTMAVSKRGNVNYFISALERLGTQYKIK